MERLDISRIQERLLNPKNRGTLQKAQRNQDRVKYHTLIDQFPGWQRQEYDFQQWVKALIPPDKFDVFRSLFRYPLKTTEISAEVFDKLSRVFNGLDRVTNIQGLDAEVRDDIEYYFNTQLDWFNRWQTEGFEYSKTEFNSFVVCDLPAEIPQGDTYPAPYFYWLFPENVVDYEVYDGFKGTLDWIAFKQPGNRLAFFDSYSYRVFRYENGQVIGEPILDNPHGLGYCPVFFFWNQPIDIRNPELKNSPILREMSSLEWYLFFYISKHYNDMSGSYPIFSVLQEDCNYDNENEYCEGGVLRGKEEGIYLLDQNGNPLPCPVCSKKRLVGPGTVVERPFPDSDNPDFDPIKRVSVDGTSLTYNVEEEKRLREEIIYRCTHNQNGIITQEAVNEDQVEANFEEQTQVLRRYKQSFEHIMNLVGATICRLRHGERFMSYNVNLGNNFYIETTSALRKQYQDARDAGASSTELALLNQKILETTNRGDNSQMERQMMLSNIEPLYGTTREEALTLYDKGLIDDATLYVKFNFDSLIKRFERENINITEFGVVSLSYDTRVNTIYNTLIDYANERRTNNTGA